MSMKNSNDTIGNRTRVLTVCSAVPQPNAPPREGLIIEILTLKETGEMMELKVLIMT
jgi:hypothetical protein